MAKTGVIYKLACQDVTAAEIYVGSTESVRNRKSGHKHISEHPEHKDHHLPVYTYINAHGGWPNWELIELERMQFTHKAELRARERYWKEHLKATLNIRVPNRSNKEWVADNKEHIQAYHQDYYGQHRDQVKARYQEKKAEISAWKKTNVDCECGAHYTKANKAVHLKSRKHQFAASVLEFIYS